METKKRPLGVTILGTFNLVVLGTFSLLFTLSARSWQAVLALLKERNTNIILDQNMIKTAALLQILVALIFMTSGAGLILGKEWARKLTVYFALLIVILALALVFFIPSFIKEAISQIIYPGILILYLTNKNVEDYFRNTDDHR
jgi:hypothetical protein